MVKHCCICKVEYGVIDDVSFHRVPSNEELKQKWLAIIGREISKHSAVCSQHFSNEDFLYKFFGDGIQRRLKLTAVPSLSKFSSKELASKSDSLSEENSNVFKQEDLGTPQIPIVHSCKETHSKYVMNVTDVDESDCVSHVKTEISDIENVQHNAKSEKLIEDKNLKRPLNEPYDGRKRNHRLRYIGDLQREDFTSDFSWYIVKSYIEKTKRKHKILNQKVQRLSKKIEYLQSLLNPLHKKLQDNTASSKCKKNSVDSKSEISVNYIFDHDYI